MKYVVVGTSISATQLAAASFVCGGYYHRHIHRMCQVYQHNMKIYTCWVRKYFPCGICITRPKGGFILWVELPLQVDVVCAVKQPCHLKIQVAPGPLFSASGKYRNRVCINCALQSNGKHREVVQRLGEAVKTAVE